MSTPSSQRKPAVVLIDELAHTNIEGSKHRKRYEDVLDLLDANIDVLSTMNFSHWRASPRSVQHITGVTVRETVPDWVLQRVTEIVMADLTPEALQTRMRRGDSILRIASSELLGNFFRPGNLIALRELALRQVAQEVDRSLESLSRKRRIGAQSRRPRTLRRLYQLQSCRTAPGCTRRSHGASARRRIVCRVCGHWTR